MLLLENTKSEIRVFVSNLRRKEEHDPNANHVLSQTLLQNNVKPGTSDLSSLDKKAVFTPGDLILFDNYQSVGLVLKVQPEALDVLNASNNHV